MSYAPGSHEERASQRSKLQELVRQKNKGKGYYGIQDDDDDRGDTERRRGETDRKEGRKVPSKPKSSQRDLPFNDFGNFFGPSKRIVSEKFLEEESTRESARRAAERERQIQEKRKKQKQAERASTSAPNGQQSRNPPQRPIGQKVSKVQDIKRSRDYSFLSSGGVPTPPKASSNGIKVPNNRPISGVPAKPESKRSTAPAIVSRNASHQTGISNKNGTPVSKLTPGTGKPIHTMHGFNLPDKSRSQAGSIPRPQSQVSRPQPQAPRAQPQISRAPINSQLRQPLPAGRPSIPLKSNQASAGPHRGPLTSSSGRIPERRPDRVPDRVPDRKQVAIRPSSQPQRPAPSPLPTKSRQPPVQSSRPTQLNGSRLVSKSRPTATAPSGRDPLRTRERQPQPMYSNSYENEDEYSNDSFVDDEEDDEGMENLASVLSMFRRNHKENHRADYDDDMDDRNMEASFSDVRKEESRSARLARIEDERERALEEESERRRLAKKRKQGR